MRLIPGTSPSPRGSPNVQIRPLRRRPPRPCGPGRVSAAQLVARIKAGGGMAKLATVQGGILTARLLGGKVVLTDEKGGRATVTQADVYQSNGVIHVTDAVSLPR